MDTDQKRNGLELTPGSKALCQEEKAKEEKPLRILILEDRPTDAELIEFELQDAGFKFTSLKVENEADYVKALQDFFPDVIVSDYDLPQYNGALALAEAKTRCPDVPFILVTGAVGEDLAIDTLFRGGKDYVMKNHLRKLVPAMQRAVAEMDANKAHRALEEALSEAQEKLAMQAEVKKVELQAKIEAWNQAERARKKIIYELELKRLTGSTVKSTDMKKSKVTPLWKNKVHRFLGREK